MVLRVHARWSESNFLGTATQFIQTPTSRFPEGLKDPEHISKPFEFFLDRAKKAIIEDTRWAVEKLSVTEGPRRPPVRAFYKDFWICTDPHIGHFDGDTFVSVSDEGVTRIANSVLRPQDQDITQSFDFELEHRYTHQVVVEVIFLVKLKQ